MIGYVQVSKHYSKVNNWKGPVKMFLFFTTTTTIKNNNKSWTYMFLT